MQGICVYVLEYMFTLEKMLNTSTLMCKSSKLSVEHSNSGLSFSYCALSTVYWVFWSSDQDINCIHIDYI